MLDGQAPNIEVVTYSRDNIILQYQHRKQNGE